MWCESVAVRYGAWQVTVKKLHERREQVSETVALVLWCKSCAMEGVVGVPVTCWRVEVPGPSR